MILPKFKICLVIIFHHVLASGYPIYYNEKYTLKILQSWVKSNVKLLMKWIGSVSLIAILHQSLHLFSTVESRANLIFEKEQINGTLCPINDKSQKRMIAFNQFPRNPNDHFIDLWGMKL